MSANSEKVKDYYEKGLWSLDRVKKAVGRWITQEEFKQITGTEYAA